MRRRRGAWSGAGALLGVLLTLTLAGPVAANAAKFVDDDFSVAGPPGGGKIVREVNGRQGFTLARKMLNESGIDYGKVKFSGREGAIQVLLARGTSQEFIDFLFLVDGGFQVDLDWRKDVPQVLIGDATDAPGVEPNSDVWGSRLLFPSAPAVGEWIVLTLTWGAAGEGNQVYVNGTPLAVEATRKFEKRQPVFVSPSRLTVGHDPNKFKAKEPNVWANMHTFMTLIGGVRVYDGALSAADVESSATAWLARDQPATIASVTHDAATVAGFSGKLVAGNAPTVTVAGSPGATGTFDVVHFPDLSRTIALDWRGWGVYLEDKVFFEEGEVNLRDVDGYRVFASTAPFDPLAPGFEPVKELKVEEQTFLLENLEIDTPYYVAVVAVMRDGALRPVLAPIANRPLTETAPGLYSGSWTVGYLDRYARAVVVGRLAGGAVAPTLVNTDAFVVDPALTIAVATDPSVLKADEKSAAKVTVTVTDANGDPVSGHKVKFVLATTSQYTGTVGGGAFTDQVGGAMQESTFGETDLFGRLTATYVAGFAAKTAVIVARDMLSNDTGAGYVQSFIQATAQLELLPVAETAAMQAGFSITVTSSDEWLTADGKSQARIAAKVELNGEPVVGHKIDFGVSSGTGSIRVVRDTTDNNGEARAVYTAGKKIGIVLITATDAIAGISGQVAIELRSDAPAKIAIKIDPETLPADGSSRADVLVLVTDINDNPNDNVEVEYLLASGSGRLRDEKLLTDRRGETSSEYTAGRSPGVVTIEITVRSTVPTNEEIAKARGFALAVTDYKFF